MPQLDTKESPDEVIDVAPSHTHSHDCHDCASHAPIERSAPKVGRNDPCPCNSGKKYKKCCLAA